MFPLWERPPMSHPANGHALSFRYPEFHSDVPPIAVAPPQPLSTAELKKRLAAELRQSDLSLKDADRLGYQVFPKFGVSKRIASLPSGCRIQTALYRHLPGKPSPEFFRFRYLEDPPRPSVAVRRKLPDRYVQPSLFPPRACFPRTFDWKSWQKEAKADPVELFITEGELKAACACKHGFPTVALGGVWNFPQQKRRETHCGSCATGSDQDSGVHRL